MLGEFAALGAAICWTISAIPYRKALLKAKPISANIILCVGTGIILFAFLVVISRFGVLLSLPAYAVILVSVSGTIGLGIVTPCT